MTQPGNNQYEYNQFRAKGCVSAFPINGFLLAMVLLILFFSNAMAEDHRIAVVTWRGETLAEKGLEKGLEAFQGPLILEKYNADQSLEKLGTIIQGLKHNPPQVIYTYGTTVTKQVLTHIKNQPVVFNIVNRPVRCGIIKSWEASGNNATGASNQISVKNQLSTLKKAIDFKKLGVIYNPLEQNSRIQRDIAKNLEKEFGFTLIDFKVENCARVLTVIQALKDTVDAVFIPADTMMVVHGTELGSSLIDYKLPSMGSLSSMVTDHGILLGLVPDYYQLGIMAASKIKQILMGTPPGEIPSSRLQFFDLYVNMETAQAINIQIPMSLLVMSNTIVRHSK